MGKAHFKREERLKSSKQIAALFKGRQSFSRFPVRVIWLEVPKEEAVFAVQFGLTVPKKKFPKATARNRIRRLLRESWRMQKAALLEHASMKEKALLVMVIYTGTAELPFSQIQAAMAQAVNVLGKKWR